MTVEAACQKLRVFRGEADHNVSEPSMLSPSPITGKDAYGIEKVYDGDLGERDWYLEDVGSNFWSAAAVYVREICASFMKVQELRHSAELRVPDTISYLLSELSGASEAVATSSTLASVLGASVLPSQNELLRANLSKLLRILQALESDLCGEIQEANAQCVELERSPDLSSPRLHDMGLDLGGCLNKTEG